MPAINETVLTRKELELIVSALEILSPDKASDRVRLVVLSGMFRAILDSKKSVRVVVD